MPPLEPNPEIENEVTHAINRVEHKGPRKEELEPALDGNGECRDRRSNRRALQMPARQRCDKVSRTERVQHPAEAGSGNALPCRSAEPGLLLVVDVEMGRDRALQPLLGEEGLRVGGGEFLGRDGSGGRGNVSWTSIPALICSGYSIQPRFVGLSA